MRTSFAVAAILLAVVQACASRAPRTSLTSPSGCPNNVLATISNNRNAPYDVYYSEGARPTMVLGEVSPGSTVTFPLPGVGTGRVYGRSANGGVVRDRQRAMYSQGDFRIRVHCSGT